MSKMTAKTCTIILAAILSAVSVSAQSIRSSYFLESMPLRHKYNPALTGEYGYVGFPALSGISINASTNFGAATFFYPGENGTLYNFLSPTVPSDEFLGKLKNNSKLNTSFDMTLISAGFRAFGGYNTLDISLHTSAEMQLPKELFRFFKVGRTSTVGATAYDAAGVKAEATAYMDIALGHSHKINEQWEVGAKIKGIVGIGHARANIDKLNLTMEQSRWIIESHGTVDISFPGIEPKKEISTDIYGKEQEVVNGFKMNGYSFGIQGGGIGFDLGAVYKPVKNLSLSLAITDIGFIHWKHNQSFQTVEDKIVYNGMDDTQEGISGENLVENFEALTKLEEVEKSSVNRALRASLNVGAEYSLLNDRISFGILSHTRFGSVTYTEGTLVANLRAPKAFAMSLNGTISNMGGSFGALLNFCPKGFNFFIGVDCYPGLKLSPQYVPVNKLNANVSLGLNFTFGDKLL